MEFNNAQVNQHGIEQVNLLYQ